MTIVESTKKKVFKNVLQCIFENRTEQNKY